MLARIDCINLILSGAEEPAADEAIDDTEVPDPPTLPPNTKLFSLMMLLPEEDQYVFLDLPEKSPELESALAFDMRDMYVLYGTEGLNAIGVAIDRLSEQPDTTSLVQRLRPEYADKRKVLTQLAKAACAALQPIAAGYALERLQSSIDEIEVEAVRYFSAINDSSDVQRVFGEGFLNPGAVTWTFKTDDDDGEAEDMIGALIELRELRTALQGSQKQEDDLLKGLVTQGNPEAVAGTLNEGARQFLYKKQPALAQARQKVDAAQEKFADALIDYSLIYPVIHRIHSSKFLPVYPAGTSTYLKAPRTKQQADLFALFRREVFDTLSRAWRAATNLYKAIDEDPEIVWEFPSLIEEVLEELDEDDVSFVSRAAAEKLKEDHLEYYLNWVALAADVSAFFTAFVFPPAGVVLEAVSYSVTLAAASLEFYRKYRQSRGAEAALDPTKSLAGTQSWGFFLFMTALQVIPARMIPMSVSVGAMVIQEKSASPVPDQ